MLEAERRTSRSVSKPGRLELVINLKTAKALGLKYGVGGRPPGGHRTVVDRNILLHISVPDIENSYRLRWVRFGLARIGNLRKPRNIVLHDIRCFGADRLAAEAYKFSVTVA
jgi:hypothetical protein